LGPEGAGGKVLELGDDRPGVRVVVDRGVYLHLELSRPRDGAAERGAGHGHGRSRMVHRGDHDRGLILLRRVEAGDVGIL
jgi:hypothetical protein